MVEIRISEHNLAIEQRREKTESVSVNERFTETASNQSDSLTRDYMRYV